MELLEARLPAGLDAGPQTHDALLLLQILSALDRWAGLAGDPITYMRFWMWLIWRNPAAAVGLHHLARQWPFM